MKKIIYKKLCGQNFLSVGNDQISVDFQSGFNLITGKNMDNPERVNGIGKSCIAELFYFALFGKTIREIKKEFIINNITKGKGAIELTFDVETEQDVQTYTIKRQVKPSTVTLLRGEEDITKDSIANTDKFICELIGSNPVICRSCDILSLSDNIPFMAKKPEDKRKFINDIFSLEVFGKMSNELKNLIRDNKGEMNISTARLEELDHTLETLNNQQADYLKKVQEREAILEQKRNDIQGKIDETFEKIAKISIPDVSIIQKEQEKYDDAWRKLDGKIGKINNDISSNETLKKIKVGKINKFSSVEEGIECEECLQNIPHTHVEHLEKLKEQYQSELNDIVEEIDKLKEEKSQFHNKKNKVQEKVAEFQEQINEAKVTKQKLEGLENSLKQYKESLDNLKLEELPKPNFEENIQSTWLRQNAENDNFRMLKQKSDDYEICKFVLSEEGVRSFVVKRLLSMMNASIQQYINDLGMTMRCKFDEYFDEQLANDKGKEISYWNLSGGERRTVDLACAWAFKDLKRMISGVSSNVEWVDEIFDSAFDAHGFDLLVQLVKKRIDKNNLAVYAISHRKEIEKHITGETIYLEKENGITRRIENHGK
jgi:DNA repair exonuclease SbcCD ATPase subunit